MTQLIQKTISTPCDPKFLQEVRETLEELLAVAGLGEPKKGQIILAVDEAVSSVIRYAQHRGYSHEITLSVDIDDVRFRALVNDSLNIFDLNGGLSDDEYIRSERSFTMGFFLMRQLMDEISYTYKKGFENRLELISFL